MYYEYEDNDVYVSSDESDHEDTNELQDEEALMEYANEVFFRLSETYRDLHPSVLKYMTFSDVHDFLQFTLSKTHREPVESVVDDPVDSETMQMGKLCPEEFLDVYQQDIHQVYHVLVHRGVNVSFKDVCDFVMYTSQVSGYHLL